MDTLVDLAGDRFDGDYDMNQMHLIPLAYRYYQELSPKAREHLITVILAKGRIHRPSRPDHFTSGGVPDDWSRAGYVSPPGPIAINLGNIGETENHILMMLTTRYLTNQLLFQRDHHVNHDNRRNGGSGRPSCLDLVLALLRTCCAVIFPNTTRRTISGRRGRRSSISAATPTTTRSGWRRGWFSITYPRTWRCRRTTFGAWCRSSPKQGDNVVRNSSGFMRVSLLGESGADPWGRTSRFRRATHVRVSRNTITVPLGVGPQQTTAEAVVWGLQGSRHELAIEALTDYRLPPSIHDLFVNDLHRRFFQRLHRTPQPGEVGGNRNCDNMEIFAGSPSYLITAGGSPATWAIDPRVAGIVFGKQGQQLGVAVTTSFMPTTLFGGTRLLLTRARDLIQLGSFSADPLPADAGKGAANYGVAPDFACGHRMELPSWAGVAPGAPGFSFVNKGSVEVNGVRGPGFYLAIYQEFGFALLEAFDTWLHPAVTFDQFQTSVQVRNAGIHLVSNVPGLLHDHEQQSD